MSRPRLDIRTVASLMYEKSWCWNFHRANIIDGAKLHTWHYSTVFNIGFLIDIIIYTYVYLS